MNPWKQIDLTTYEKHMSLGNVYQLQTLSRMMKEQFYAYSVSSIMILGIAGGNGLEHIDQKVIQKVYGVDVNPEYLETCKQRYGELSQVLETICVDLTHSSSDLPYAELVIANLFIEYVGYQCFQKVIAQISPKYVSAVIQINEEDAFVSDSPYINAFECLGEVHHQMEEKELVDTMERIGYSKGFRIAENLPNGKKLIRIDFLRKKESK